MNLELFYIRCWELIARIGSEDKVFNQESFQRIPMAANDVLYLIEQDTATVPSRGCSPHELNTNLHHLAWAIFASCGVRPGSVFPDEQSSEDKEEYLQWKDMRIIRRVVAFVTRTTFRWLKGKHDKNTFDRRRVSSSAPAPIDFC